MFFQKELETMPRKEIEALQLARLRHTVDYAMRNVRLYHDRYSALGITADKIKTLSDVAHLPFTTKADFQEQYPLGMLAVPRSEIVRIQGSSGTTSKPILNGWTKQDLDTWAQLVARLAASVGVSGDDVAQIAFGYGLFTGGFGLHYGLEKLGCMVIPLSSGNTERQLYMMQDLGASVLVCTPSYALYLAECVKQQGLAGKLPLRVGLFGGEGCSAEMRAEIEQQLGIKATDNYGLCELGGPGVSGECLKQQGLHIAEDHYLAEVIDSASGQPLPAGSQGELVFTTLTREAMPVIRYRTRDISCLNTDTCDCGRTFARMDRIRGRADDMFIIKGVNVFPSQVESVIIGVEGVGPHYELVLRRSPKGDSLEVRLEMVDASLLERFADLARLEREVTERLHSVLGLRAKVSLVEPASLGRFEGKAKRVRDLREQGEA